MGNHVSRRDESRERGMGVILVILSVLVLAVLTVGMVFNSRIGIFASYNYRIDTQAAYVAEGGLQKSLNWFKNSYSPAAASNYNLNVSPVTMAGNNQVVKLDGKGGAHNYPDNTITTSFQNNLMNQTLTAATTPALNGSFTVVAILQSARPVTLLGGGSTLLERWQVDSQGNAAGVAQASVVLTRLPQYLPSYAALGCAAVSPGVSLGSGGTSDSYNSAAGAYGGGNVSAQGNLGSNGSISLATSAVVQGAVNYGLTPAPSPATPPSGGVSPLSPPFDCTKLPLPTNSLPIGSPSIAVGSGGSTTISPGNYNNLSADGGGIVGGTLTLNPGTYNINSIRLDGGPPAAKLVISGPTVINIIGTDLPIHPPERLSMDSNTVSNTGPPSNLVFYMPGTDPSKVGSGSTSSFVVIAPNSDVTIDSTGTVFGTIIGRTVHADSGAKLHYDTALASSVVLSLTPLQAISWNRGAR